MKIDIDLIDWDEFERRLRTELGREAFVTTSEMTTIIADVVASDGVRGMIHDHDGSDFERWRALFTRYPEALAVRLEDRLASAGFPLSERLDRLAFLFWRRSVWVTVERAAKKAMRAEPQ